MITAASHIHTDCSLFTQPTTTSVQITIEEEKEKSNNLDKQKLAFMFVSVIAIVITDTDHLVTDIVGNRLELQWGTKQRCSQCFILCLLTVTAR